MSGAHALNLEGVRDGATKDLLKQVLKTPGWHMEKRASGHIMIHGPNGASVTSSTTPKSQRSVNNLKAQLRRAGWNDGQQQKKEKQMAEAVEHPEVTRLIEIMLPGGGTVQVPDFGFEWEFVDGPPESMRNQPNPPKLEVVTAEVKDEKAIEDVVVDDYRRKSVRRRLVELTMDDFEDAEPPKRGTNTLEEANNSLDELVLNLVTESPGKWKKLKEPMTTTYAKYLQEAGKRLSVKVTTRFVRIEYGKTGWLYVRVEEES